MYLHNKKDDTPIEDCFDRVHLAQIQQRFLNINAQRLSRARDLLSSRQTIFLDALPLLFHCNHPMLPGFVSHATPCGVSGYKPDRSDLALGKAMARSFCLAAQGYHEDIWSIFIMGSAGTLAQNRKSDFDIWLCHKPSLSTVALKELADKCERISHWASTLKLEVHFFLMDSEAFLRGEQAELDEEASGSAQRYLLLDEFYRTALHVAGRMPAWWFVPPKHESEYRSYLQRLLDDRFIKQNNVIDFGSAFHIPIGEFLGAGIWQLYKAIQSPHKSVLKLLLMESYIHEPDNPKPLSYYFKEQIYDAKLTIDNLDPYYMIYQKIESYLNSINDVDRLEIVRRCMYFKINKALSHESRLSKNWQRKFLTQLVRDWRWKPEYLRILDERKSWPVLKVKEERNLIVNALNQSYSALTSFAQRHAIEAHITSAELTVLGRKLQAAYEKRPGKVEWINPDISKDISESMLTLIAHKHIAGKEEFTWQLFSQTAQQDTPLKQSNSLVELILWGYCNKIITKHTAWQLDKAGGITAVQIQRLLSGLQKFAPKPDTPANSNAFKYAAIPESALLIANAKGLEPSKQKQDIALRLSDATDAFNYGSFNENLVSSIDIIVKNSWHEYTCTHMSGPSVIVDALDKLFSLCMPGSHQQPPSMTVESLDQKHAPLISKRLSQWLHELSHCYYSGTRPPSTRYVYAINEKYICLQFKGPRLISAQPQTRDKLIKHLGESQSRYSPVVLDSYCLREDILNIISRKMSAKAVQLFFRVIDKKFDIYIADERGSITRHVAEYTPEHKALHAMHAFLRSAMERIPHLCRQHQKSSFGVFPIEFYQVSSDPKHRLYLASKHVTPDLLHNNILPIKSEIHTDDNGHFAYDFFCKDTKFLWSDHGQQVFSALADYVLSHRNGKRAYPIFITDLDLEGCKQHIATSEHLQLCHYLRVKVELERKVNDAIKRR